MKCNEHSEAARAGTDADLYRKTHAVTAKKKNVQEQQNAAIPSKHEDCGDSVFIGNGRSGGI